VTAKDVAMKIIAELGVAGGRGFVVEYAGSAVRAMPIEQRHDAVQLNIELGGAPVSWGQMMRPFRVAQRPAMDAEGAQMGYSTWRQVAQLKSAMTPRSIRTQARLLKPRAAISWGHRFQPGGRYQRARARCRERRAQAARRNGKRLRLYGRRGQARARRDCR